MSTISRQAGHKNLQLNYELLVTVENIAQGTNIRLKKKYDALKKSDQYTNTAKLVVVNGLARQM